MDLPLHPRIEDSAYGMMIGLAIGDAMGAPLEFQEGREPENYVKKYMSGGAHNVSPGEFTDDMSMALAMADAFVEAQEFEPHLIMQNFLEWKNNGAYSPRGVMFDCGNTVYDALRAYEKDGSNPFTGSTDKYAAGNGGLMRLAPAILFAKTEEEAVINSRESTRLTHGAEEALFYSEIFAKELFKAEINPEFDEFKHPLNIERVNVMSGGYVKETYQAAWWAYQTTDNFYDCIIQAINRGHDSDTTGAVAGMIAGCFYGFSKIPHWMVEQLQWHEKILLTTTQLMLPPTTFTNWLTTHFFDENADIGDTRNVFGRRGICINPAANYGGGSAQLWAIEHTEARFTSSEYQGYIKGRCLKVDQEKNSILFKANHSWNDDMNDITRWIDINVIQRYDANWY